MIRDISERKRAERERTQLEQELYQAQKLESIGTLASGIAHDFNNILSIIMGHALLLNRIAHDNEKFAKSINAITKATERGASLVRQMLTFARKTETLVEPLDLNILVEEVAKMLLETFPKTIELRIELEHGLPPIVAGATQIHQIVLNLCVNARDAMPRGGTLVVSTARADGESLSRRFPNITAHEYATLIVSDTGVGMDKQVSERIFEPFFSTKGPGRGTGLGLSVVHGIVTSHGGFIDFTTELGKGTTFFVYFPIPEQFPRAWDTQKQMAEPARGGTETILLIEDEELLRKMLGTLLQSEGYRVLTAENGEEGVALYEQHKETIDLVVSDLGLPKMSGAEVFRRLRALNPKARVVIASGYFEPQERAELLRLGVAQLLNKPYQSDSILRVVRGVLDSKT